MENQNQGGNRESVDEVDANCAMAPQDASSGRGRQE